MLHRHIDLQPTCLRLSACVYLGDSGDCNTRNVHGLTGVSPNEASHLPYLDNFQYLTLLSACEKKDRREQHRITREGSPGYDVSHVRLVNSDLKHIAYFQPLWLGVAVNALFITVVKWTSPLHRFHILFVSRSKLAVMKPFTQRLPHRHVSTSQNAGPW